MLVAANRDTATVTVWSVPDRTLLHTVPAATDAAIAPDGRTFASYDGGRQVIVRNTTDLAEITRYRTPEVSQLSYSPDGSTIATMIADVVAIHRVADGVPVTRLVGHTARIMSIAFDQTGTRLVTASQVDDTVRVWDIASAAVIGTVRCGGTGALAAAFGFDNDTLLIGGTPPGVGVRSVNGTDHPRLRTRAVGTRAIAVARAPEAGRLVLGAGASGEVTIWSQADSIGFHDRAVLRVAAQPGGSGLVTTTGDGST